MATIAVKPVGEEDKDSEVFGPRKRVVKSKLMIYSDYEKGSTCGLKASGSNGSRKSIVLKKAMKELKANNSKGPTVDGGGKLETLMKVHVGRKALADVSNVGRKALADVSNVGRKALADVSDVGRKALADVSNVGRTSVVNAHVGSQQVKKKSLTGTFTRGSWALRRNSSVTLSQSSVGKRTASTACGVGSSHASGKVIETISATASSSAQVGKNLKMRTSFPVTRKATRVGKSNGKESAESADQDKQKYGFPVKRRVGGTVSQASDATSKLRNNRVSDGSLVMDSSALRRRKSRASLIQSLVGKRTARTAHAVDSSHASGGENISTRATSSFQKPKAQDCKNLNDRCKAKITNQAMRKSFPVTRKASHVDKSNAKENAKSADVDKRKFDFLVKRRVEAKVKSQASDAKSKLWKDRVNDGFLVMGSRGQSSSNACEKLKKSTKPILRTGLTTSKYGRPSKSRYISSLDKSQPAIPSKNDIEVVSCVPNSTDSVGCHEAAEGELEIKGSNNFMQKIPVVSISKKSARRKSYTSMLISGSKLMEESVVTKLEKLSSIDDQTNPLEVAEYVDEIYLYYWAMEAQSASLENHLVNQTEVTPQMRGVLVNWLIEVHHRFDLMPETLYLTVALLDRYLSLVTISKGQMQLVGLTALLLASKYEDFWHPRVKDLISISAESYTKEQVLEMEKDILRKLKFRFNLPTAYVFMLRFLKASQSETKQLEHLAFYLLELCLVEYKALSFKPSMICAAALYIARRTLQLTPTWTPLLVRHSHYQESQIRDCAEMVLRFQRAAKGGLLKVTYEKYMQPELGKVAVIKPLPCLPI